jgi:hypothetical protein
MPSQRYRKPAAPKQDRLRIALLFERYYETELAEGRIPDPNLFVQRLPHALRVSGADAYAWYSTLKTSQRQAVKGRVRAAASRGSDEQRRKRAPPHRQADRVVASIPLVPPCRADYTIDQVIAL